MYFNHLLLIARELHSYYQMIGSQTWVAIGPKWDLKSLFIHLDVSLRLTQRTMSFSLSSRVLRVTRKWPTRAKLNSSTTPL